MVKAVVVALAAIVWAAAATAQNLGWVQIEARPSEPQAVERAQAYAARLPNVNGFALPSGWYAIALGPYDRFTAEQELRRLRAQGAVPGDSFISDGRGFGRRIFGDGFTVLPEQVAAPPQPLQPAEETLADSRAAERLLTALDRAEIQEALQWEGFYTAAIDAAFGPGTRRAIGDWQLARLRADGRALHRAAGRADRRLARGADEPRDAARLRRRGRDRDGAPDGAGGARAPRGALRPLRCRRTAAASACSSSASRATNARWADFTRSCRRSRSFRSRDPASAGRGPSRSPARMPEIISTTYAELANGAVKGFTLVWPAGDERRRTRALEAMRASFTPTAAVLPDLPVAEAAQGRDLLSGIRIRQPERMRSGFYVSAAGQVVTSAEAVAACDRVTLDDRIDARVTAADPVLGVALLTPAEALVPIRTARLQSGTPRLQSDVAVAGFPYGDALAQPTVTFGRLADLRGLGGEETLKRLALDAEDGDTGGPVLDATGAVLGVLLPRDGTAARQLPPDVSFAADASALASFLSQNGVNPAASDAVEPIAPEDLTVIAADMTVRVSCWN
jgi:S1-C subfamily serine protease